MLGVMRSPRSSHKEISNRSSAPAHLKCFSSTTGERDWNQKARLTSVERGSQLPVMPKEQCQPPKVGFCAERTLCPIKYVHIRAVAVSEPRCVVSA